MICVGDSFAYEMICAGVLLKDSITGLLDTVADFRAMGLSGYPEIWKNCFEKSSVKKSDLTEKFG